MPSPAYIHWPHGEIFVIENHKILFCPIAKNACTSLKALIMRLSDIPDREAHIANNIQHTSNTGRTGIKLWEKEPAIAEAAIDSPDYMRIAVLREPRARLVSAFVEKFAVNRKVPGNQGHTGDVVAAVQGAAAPEDADFATGITFRQFAEYVLSVPPESLDSHWIPQANYLAGVAYTHLYTVDALDVLAQDLATRTGGPVSIGHANKTRHDAAGVDVADAADLLPGAFRNIRKASVASFYADDDLRARLERYFAIDHTLYAAAAEAMRLRQETLQNSGEPPAAPAAAVEAAPGMARMRLKKALSLNGLRRSLGLPPVRKD